MCADERRVGPHFESKTAADAPRSNAARRVLRGWSAAVSRMPDGTGWSTRRQASSLAPALLITVNMSIPAYFIFALALSATACAQDVAGQVLAEINLARTQPQSYAAIVSANARAGREGDGAIREAVRFLEKARPLPALASCTALNRSAMDHVADTGSRGTMSHAGSDGSHTWDRVERYGRWVGTVGENISYGTRSAREIVVALLVDDGVHGRKHRVNIFQKDFRVVGVAYGRHSRMGAMCVTDFAGGFIDATAPLAKL